MIPYRSRVILAGTVCLLVFSGWANARNATITLEDTSSLHVHPAGKSFNVKVKVSYSGTDAGVSCHWQNYKGQLLGPAVNLTAGQAATLSSPGAQPGYYELIFSSRASDLVFPNRRAGETREYGFAILPDRSMDQRIPDSHIQFGIVHGDPNDPYVPTWVKTLTWNTEQRWWRLEVDKRRARKLLELPIAAGDVWVSDDTQPITPAAISALKTKIAGYFQADPQTLYWELGLEENLNWANFSATHFFPNLESKVRAVREAADAVNPNIKLVYQLVATEVTDDVITAFLQSGASQAFDILSLHPYRWRDNQTLRRWEDFPMPDTWMAGFLSDVQAKMQQLNRVMPIWITEIGATHHGNGTEFFGYPQRAPPTPVVGLSRPDSVRYLVQSHIIALYKGVEKIFWYNYMDRDPKRDEAEDHFGLKDYWGFPKSAYVAYTQMHLALEGKRAAEHRTLAPDVQVYRFNGTVANNQDQDVLVVWRSADTGNATLETTSVALSQLLPGLTAQRVVSVVDSVGATQAVNGASVLVGHYPVYITFR